MEDEHSRSTPLDSRKSRILFMAVIVPHGWSESAKHFIACQEELELITAEEAPSLEYFMGLMFTSEDLSFQGGNFLLIHFSSLKCVCSCNYSNCKQSWRIFLLLLSSSCLIFSSSSSPSILLSPVFSSTPHLSKPGSFFETGAQCICSPNENI